MRKLIMESKYGKRVAGIATAAALGYGALTGCGNESAPQYNNNESPPVSASPSSGPSSKTPEVIANPVQPGPIGSLKDKGREIANHISEASVVDDEQRAVAQARQAAQKLGNTTITARTNDDIDSRLSSTTRYPAFYTSADSSNEHNIKEAQQHEATVDLIANPTIKAQAEKNLDYQEAKSAIEAGTGSAPHATVSAALLGFVENPEIKTLAQQAIGGDGAAKTTFDAQARDAGQTVERQGAAAFSSLYDGSDSQAAYINQQLQAFNEARGRDGQ